MILHSFKLLLCGAVLGSMLAATVVSAQYDSGSIGSGAKQTGSTSVGSQTKTTYTNSDGSTATRYTSNDNSSSDSNTTSTTVPKCAGIYIFGFCLVLTPPSPPSRGNFEGTNVPACSVSGWAFDPTNPTASIGVHVYRDGPAGVGRYVSACTANLARPDVNATFSISGNHGFNCTLPDAYKSLGNRNLYIHAIDSDGRPNTNPVIGGSPKRLNCIPPAPVSITATCVKQANHSFLKTMSWPAVPGATHYALRVDRPNDPAPHIIQNDTVSGITFTSLDPALSNGQMNAWVHACNSGGCSQGAPVTSFTCPRPTLDLSVRVNDGATYSAPASIVIAPADSLNFNWTSTNAAQCTANFESNVSVNDNVLIARHGAGPGANSPYTVSCTSEAGSVSETFGVRVPELNILLNSSRSLVRIGETVVFDWDIELAEPLSSGLDLDPYPMECTFTGAVNAAFDSSLRPSGTITSSPISNSVNTRLTCVDVLGGSTYTKSVDKLVEVVPRAQEI